MNAQPVQRNTETSVANVVYHHATRTAAFDLCRITPGAPRQRVCQIALAAIPDGGGLAAARGLVNEPGVQFGSPVFSPDGRHVYATRQRLIDWRERLYRSPQQVVRIDVATGQYTVLAHAQEGLAAVLQAAPADDGEVLHLTRTTRFNGELPEGGASSFLTWPGSSGEERAGDEPVYGKLYSLTIGRCGFVFPAAIGSDTTDRSAWRYVGARAEEAVTGRHRSFSTLIEAVDHVGRDREGCARAYASARYVAGQAASSPRYDTSIVRNLQPLPEHFVVQMDRSRSFEYFRDRRDPYGNILLGWDLDGGAIALPSGQVENGRLAYRRLQGHRTPYQNMVSGELDFTAVDLRGS